MEPIRLNGYSVHFHEGFVQIVSPDGEGLKVPSFLLEKIIERLEDKSQM